MKKWIKRVFVIFIAVVSLSIWLAFNSLYRFTENWCATTIIDRIASPDGKTQAILFAIDCGATTGFNRHVSIVTTDTDLSAKNLDVPKSAFAARGEPKIKLAWLTSDRLEVQYPKNTETIRTEKISSGVVFEYRKVP